MRESKFRVEHEHKLLRDEVAAVRMRTKAFALERARSLAATSVLLRGGSAGVGPGGGWGGSPEHGGRCGGHPGVGASRVRGSSPG